MSDVTSRTDELAAAAEPRPAAVRGVLSRVAGRRSAAAGLIGLTLVLFVAAFAPLVTPSDPFRQDLGNVLAPPFWSEAGSLDHPLGTDALGRDVASRIAYGARNSIIVGVFAVLIGSVLGLAAGLTAGFYGGKLDSVLMRLGDVQLAFPFILLAIVILGVIPERTLIHLIIVLGIPGWIIYARVVRSRTIAEREKDYIVAANALGAGRFRQMVKYVLPSVWHVAPVIALLDLGFLVIIESTLSFLGFGLTPPTPSWGSILADGRNNMVISPWLPVLPGLAIMLTVLSINLIADGLADVLDPKYHRATFRRVALRIPVWTAEPDDHTEPLLRVRDLHVEFPLRDRVVGAVRGVSFDLARGQALGIVGESGSGKSVTALSIVQLLDSPGRVTRGQILLEGQDVARLSDREVARLRGRRLAMIFQNPTASLNPVLSIEFQMREAIRRHGRFPGAERAVARQLLRDVGIGDPDRVLRQYPFQLSGGMNQRVMIAMAMSARPDLLIADEPTTALDVTTQAQILGRLRQLTREHDTSLILITHDIALVSEYADQVLVMYAGQVCEVGPARSVIEDPRHPYTRALLESVPRAALPSGALLHAIPGELPDPADVPSGCPFAPRCPSVMDVCRSVNPDRFVVAPHHRAACHLWAPDRTSAVAR
ncbi:MAG: dipeptide/oligopeptide/nickel ABC transporter permease/ATP-binding protein [Acidimicrobiales bacterium]